MTRVLRTLIATGVLALVSAPVKAHADAFVVPWVGSVFGGDAATRRTTLGVSAGDLGGGPVGFDVELGYASKFFGDEMEFGSNSLITVMADAILGPLLGGVFFGPVRAARRRSVPPRGRQSPHSRPVCHRVGRVPLLARNSRRRRSVSRPTRGPRFPHRPA